MKPVLRLAVLTALFPVLLPPIGYAASAMPDGPRQVPATQAEITMSFAPLVQQVAPAVVNIHTKRTVLSRPASPFMNDPFFRQFFGGALIPDMGGGLTRKQVEGALGSGLIIDPDGVVVTNAHVIRGADEIRIVLSDGREFDAHLSLQDEQSDLAILRVDSGDARLPSVTLRPSEELEVGDLVLAIGNPFGVGQTVTSGIVSALARSSLNINDYNFFIQTDAAINPGNSGGPLVSMDGRVVGINTAIYSQSGGSLGIGFAIPSEMVETVIAAEQAGKTGSGIKRPWLGVTGDAVTRDIADSLGLEMPGGTLITGLHPASPLAQAGVRIGDVILSLNGRMIRDGAEMKYRMATLSIGAKPEIGIFRNGETVIKTITTIAPPDEPARDETLLKNGFFKGVTIANMNPAVAHEMGYGADDEEGVVVMAVDRRSGRGGHAARFLKAGDMIVSYNGAGINKTADLKKIISGAGSRQAASVNLVIRRNGALQQIVIR